MMVALEPLHHNKENMENIYFSLEGNTITSMKCVSSSHCSETAGKNIFMQLFVWEDFGLPYIYLFISQKGINIQGQTRTNKGERGIRLDGP